MSRYKAYPEYKDSGIETIGSIPYDWQVWKWKHLLLSPMTYGANEAALDDNRSHPRYIRITDMNPDGTLRDDSFKSLTPTVAKDYLLEDGDLLVARTGATVGKSFLYKREFGISCFAGYLIRARVNQKIVNPKFVYWYMQSGQYWKFVSGSQIQATIQNVSAEKYGDMEFAIPDLTPLCEKIANFLDHETAKIDTLIAKQQELIKLLKEKRQAVISHAVTKGLNPNAPMRDSGVEWLGEVPAHWITGKCGYHFSFLSGFAFPSVGFSTNEENPKLLRGINVGVSALKWNETVFWERKPGDGLDEFMLKDGDLVIGMDRPWISDGVRVAKVTSSDLPCLLLQRVALIRVEGELHVDYIFRFFSSGMFVAHFSPETTGVSVPHISPDQIKNFQISLPPIEEQLEIIEYLEEKISRIDSLISEAENAIELMQERRTALISAAVTGKIDVRDWQPPVSEAQAA